eukprot:GEMP01049561.1.p1 GENE.GEMP01049561.1~~GEMP01049561.1.p1  ORF type:complete len:301 (+),score=30.94 GEMP01049561.1:45-947(+)
MRLDATFPLLPSGLALHLVGSFIACGCVFFICGFFSPLLVPKYNSFSTHQKFMWCSMGSSLFGTLMASIFVSKDMPRWVEYFWITGFGPYDDLLALEISKPLAHAVGISLGYMAFDLILLVIRWNFRDALDARGEVRKPKGKPTGTLSLWKTFMVAIMKLYWQLVFHHIVSLVSWFYVVINSRCVLYVFYLISTEFTSIFLNTFTLMSMATYNGILKDIVGALLLLSYIIVRLLPIPLFTWIFCTASYDKFSLFEKVLGATTIPWPIVLNIYWFVLIIRVCNKRLRGAPASSTDVKNKSE